MISNEVKICGQRLTVHKSGWGLQFKSASQHGLQQCEGLVATTSADMLQCRQLSLTTPWCPPHAVQLMLEPGVTYAKDVARRQHTPEQR